MKIREPMPFGQRLLAAFAVGYMVGWLWPGGFVGALFTGLGVLFLYCVVFLVWSFLSW